MRAVLCEAWNGTGAYTYDRIGRGTLHIRAACVSVLGVVQGALDCLADLGWLRPEAVRPGDGGRPSVRFHTNPRLATLARGPARGRRSPKVAR